MVLARTVSNRMSAACATAPASPDLAYNHENPAAGGSITLIAPTHRSNGGGQARNQDVCKRPLRAHGVRRANGSLTQPRRGPVGQRQSGAPLAATNVEPAGSACKWRDAVRLGRKEGLQPRASERPAVGCSEKLGGGYVPQRAMYRACRTRHESPEHGRVPAAPR
jgi:hypothetical protein